MPSIYQKMKRRRHAYFLKVARSLGACQLVELELKFYISQSLELVAKLVAGRMPFKMVGKDYQDSSLERLIEMFRKLSDNTTLVQRLVRFKEERNFVAHKAIIACLDLEGELLESNAEMTTERLRKIEREATILTEAINEESGKFLARLYFDAQSESS